jgi:hypothetical protein
MIKPIPESAMERRAFQRTSCNRGGLLCIPGSKKLVPYTIRDVSERGLGLKLHDKLDLRPHFLVVEEGSWAVRQCHLLWREGGFAGAEFLDRTRSPRVAA